MHSCSHTRFHTCTWTHACTPHTDLAHILMNVPLHKCIILAYRLLQVYTLCTCAFEHTHLCIHTPLYTQDPCRYAHPIHTCINPCTHTSAYTALHVYLCTHTHTQTYTLDHTSLYSHTLNYAHTQHSHIQSLREVHTFTIPGFQLCKI